MRTKENNFLPRYDTNKKIKDKIDKINRRINEGICPILNAIDCTEKERRTLTAEKNKLKKEVKQIDPEYWEQVYKIYKG